jgi:hypothetical protein
VDGLRIAVQLHGEPLPDVVEALTVAGAEVIEVMEVPVDRWMPPVDIGPLARLIDGVLARCVHVLAFTSAPVAASVLARAVSAAVGAGEAAVDQEDAFGPQAGDLLDGDVRGARPVGPQHAVPRQVVAVDGEDAAHEPWRAQPGAGRDLAVARRLARRDREHDGPHPLDRLLVHALRSS